MGPVNYLTNEKWLFFIETKGLLVSVVILFALN